MKSFPFDSDITYDADGNPEYDRGADSTILAQFLHLMFSDGVFPNPSTGLQVTASSEEMSVVVKPGNCMIQGRMGIEELDRTLVFNASGTTYDRIDSVVARLNTNHDYRNVDLYVVKGTEASSPVAPELTRTGGIYELRLANVFIAKNTTVISAERITDTRLADECGIVTSNPNPVDTASIFNQYQAALDKYMQYVQDCIDGTTAGNLQEQINSLVEENKSQDTKIEEINSSLMNLSSDLKTKQISLKIGANTWSFYHGSAYKTGNLVLLNFRAIAQVNSTTLCIKDFISLIGDFFQTSIIVFDDTKGVTKLANLQKSGNDLNLIFLSYQEKNTAIVGNFMVVLK